MKLPRAMTLALGPALASLGIRALGRTLRLRHDESPVDHLLAVRAPVIFVAWHGRTLLMPWVYGHLAPRMLVSRSRDGELQARVLARFSFGSVRGSSNRGGAGALRALVETLKEGESVGVIPDGPRGPRERVKPGVAVLARLSGAPVVPVAVGAAPEWQVDSWDRFRIPRPFARCMARMGAPISPPADRQHEEATRAAIEQALAELSARVDAEVRA